jgi:hypothetical protein
MPRLKRNTLMTEEHELLAQKQAAYTALLKESVKLLVATLAALEEIEHLN